MTETKDGAKILAGCAVLSVWVPFVLVAGTIAEAAVMLPLWRWFVEPFGLPAIGMGQAVGISTLVALLTHQTPPKNKQADDGVASFVWWSACSAFLRPAVLLAVGYVAWRFVG